MPNAMLRTADVIAQKLYAAGCRHAFGIPGGEVLTIMDALVRVGIRFTLTKHENAAGFMAEGVHHATGAPAILLATVGPGVANAVNTIANAHQDRVPLVVLTGCVDDAEAVSYTHQIFDHQALLRPITKATFRAVADASDIVVDKAIAIAREGRPGPVHIDIPIGVAAAAHRPAKAVMRGPATLTGPIEDAVLERARSLFQASREPILLAGVDVINEPGAADAVRRFAERHQVPVLTTYKAKGVLPEDHPLCLGGHGLSPLSDKTVLPLLRSADCILSVGYDPIEMRLGWRDLWDPSIVIEFAAELNRHDMHHAGFAWTSGIAAGLASLEANVPSSRKPSPRALAARAELKRVFAPAADWGPGVAFDVLRSSVPRDTVVTADSGAHRILLSQQWECYRERGMLQSSALCTMGCALPLAIGYKLASPETPVLAFMGDAGLEMVAGELATLRDLKLPVIVCVMVDRSLTLIEMKQRGSQLPNVGVDFGGTDFAAVAAAFGGVGTRISSRSSLETEIRSALGRKEQFTLLAIDIGRRAYEGRF
ncbi:MAG: thiamine pyrophosphate-binding protein [Hyphomonadaceae bacterium]|jgi:acetolactate synthase-1/2/3 large subunit|nr:thiamine pyrophosphate-binding protein [Hyphomonadaceae bacterium]